MGDSVNFVVRVYGTPTTRSIKNALVLTTDEWDDFGTKCYYHLSFADTDGTRTEIGTLKILQRDSSKEGRGEPLARTVLPEQFSSLDSNFISLGQEEGYYTNLHKHCSKEQVAAVLEGLRDIAWQPDLAAELEPTSAFRNSLMRFNEAQRARRFGQALALGQAVTETFSFVYDAEIEGAAAAIETTIPFDSKDGLPGRVVGIVGRNAVGKTQFLANLATDLCQIGRLSGEAQSKRDARFNGQRPLFTRVLAISYSAFDRFTRPKSVAISYIYCGIRSEGGGLSRKALIERYRKNQGRIREMRRMTSWTRFMSEILDDPEGVLAESLNQEINDPAVEDSALSLLSSGQSILVHFVTSLLAWLEPNSLVLFDEPETHLHPNAVASLFNVLTAVLQEYESFAIVATHSPIVIQEIPAKRVVVFRREGDLTVAEPLLLESFGESLTELTRHVFETNEVSTLYRRTLSRLAREEDIERTMARFERELSLSAQAFLIAQHEREDQ
jgi:ABC-type phosphonate transport system ATPase subunit